MIAGGSGLLRGRPFVKPQLKAKGFLPQAPKRQRSSEKPGQFITASVGDSARPGSLICRLRHPSGWLMECGSWPEPSWLRDLTGEHRWCARMGRI